jgi:hypothetical protein
MEMRLNDVVINERPKFLTNHPTDNDHAIIIDDLVIPLEIHKVASYFHGRKQRKNTKSVIGWNKQVHSPNGVHMIPYMQKNNPNAWTTKGMFDSFVIIDKSQAYMMKAIL